jgi:hypothetical protein
MDLELTMSLGSKKELYQVVKYRYQRSNRAVKTTILDEFSANTGFSRKYAIRLLNSSYKPRKHKPGPKSKYSNDLEFCIVLKACWKLLNYCSGKLLKEQLGDLVFHYEQRYKAVTPSVRVKLEQVSSATIDRILKKHRSRGRVTTKPGSLLRTEIPIMGSVWEETEPGFVEADTVAHCGMTTKGTYINTVTLTDIATQWTECRAIFGKGADATLDAIRDMQQSFPFEIKGFDCDNGSEFLNHHLVKYMAERNIRMTRSRPYRKNDNAHVEQKNWSYVRQLMGYGRMENPDLVPVMNQIYKHHWCIIKNFWTPCMKLIEKKRVGSKIYKIHDKPKTPYQRVLESSFVTDENKEKLKRIYEAHNPFVLKDEMRRLEMTVVKLAKISYEDWKNNQVLSA